MRIDIVSVFPRFFDVLELSLLGKAQERGILDVVAHDLRDWTDDPHRTVDDTPAGGGAGMVMRPDVWGKALDEVIGADAASGEGDVVLAIPTPAGEPLTQRACEELSRAERIVVACGRYEGIDARVASEYSERPGVRVFEYSLGDYVLNGGEVAAVALVEAVGRLLPGMVGNPESLLEESHGAAGLLEYPVYTRPTVWRRREIPEVLTSGNHGAVARWRRDRAIERTIERRPDMIEKINAASLGKKERRALAAHGYLAPAKEAHPARAEVRRAAAADVPELASLAAKTFPDACPKGMPKQDIDAFIAENLGEEHFERYVEDPGCLTMALEVGGRLLGYSLTYLPEDGGVSGADRGAPVDAVVAGRPRRGPLVELSKFYLDRSLRGRGAGSLLWEATRAELQEWAENWPEPYVWLGTNEKNTRARQAYRGLGFEFVGTRDFLVGEQNNVDRVFARPIRVA